MSFKEQSKIILKKIFLYDVIFFTLHSYHLLRNNIRRSRNYYNNIFLYFSCSHSIDKTNSVVFFLTNANYALHCFPLMCFLEKSGFNILMIHNYTFIARCVFGIRGIFRLRNLKIIRNPRKYNNVVMYFYDNLHKKSKLQVAAKFYIKDIIYSKNSVKEIHVPYPMHPMVYDKEIYNKTGSYRLAERKMKIFFSGNTHKETYKQYKIHEKYHILDRFEIIDYLRKTFDTEKLHIAVTTDYIDGIFMGESNYSNKITMIDWQWKIEHGKFDLRIENTDWVYFLSRADFFLACPGVKIPFCHNIVEAMSVGAIPLTNYGHLFDPPLTDMVNCISFDKLETLVTKINLILKMKKEEIDTLRSNVIDYYDNILDMERFCNKLISDVKNPDNELVVFSEQFNIS
jgi:hypothetical protein